MHRRDFIKTSAAAAAGIILIPGLTLSDDLVITGYENPHKSVEIWYFKYRSTGYKGSIKLHKFPAQGEGPTYFLNFDYVYEKHYTMAYSNGPGQWKEYPARGYRRFYMCLNDSKNIRVKLDELHQEVIDTNPKWIIPTEETGPPYPGLQLVELCSNKGLKEMKEIA